MNKRVRSAGIWGVCPRGVMHALPHMNRCSRCAVLFNPPNSGVDLTSLLYS